MTCKPCSVVRQLAVNYLLAADMAVNAVVLLGFPGETISKRLARARRDGSPPVHRAAAVACAVLTWFGKRVFGASGDHCTWAIDPNTASIGAELVSWSPKAPQ